MIAVRTTWGEEVEYLHQETFPHGTFKKNGKHHPSNSNVLIAKVHLKHPVAHLKTQTPVCMVFHFHNHCARGAVVGRATENKKMLAKIPELMKEWDVTFFAADCNMSLLTVVHAVRTSGLLIDVTKYDL